MDSTSAALGTAYPVLPSTAAESSTSAICWQAILGGAVAAASASLVLLTLGAGLGLSSLSAWPNAGASATAFTIGAGIWLIVVQWLASGLGGYITGRLRTKWVRTHTHEVFFRDTAHGFLTWAVATVVGALMLAAAASSALGTGTRAAAAVTAGAAQGAGTAAAATQGGGASTGSQGAGGMASLGYDVDTLFRGQKPELAASNRDADSEATRILTNGLRNGGLPDADRSYLADTVAARTGLSQADAQKRVDGVIAQEKAAEVKARQEADAARKSTSAVAIFTALSMLIGAFIASAAAALGGSLRDEHV
jgi:hypothetical protein